jgi:hypothetical protein
MLPAKTHSLHRDRIREHEEDCGAIWWENAYQESNEVRKLLENANQLRLTCTRRFGGKLCDLLRCSELYGWDLQPHEDAPNTEVRLYVQTTVWTSHGKSAGAVRAEDPYALLLNRVQDMVRRYGDAVVLVYYASLRTMLQHWLTHAGYTGTSVRTIRQSKGTWGCIMDRPTPAIPYTETRWNVAGKHTKTNCSEAARPEPAFSWYGRDMDKKFEWPGRFETRASLQ